jgi:predicted PurR-regulated permease PerM
MTEQTESPRWNSTTKLVVALTLVAIVAALLVKFQAVLPPLIIAFVLVYLLYPVASLLTHRLRLNWSVSVSVIYGFLILVMLGLLTITGLEIVVQIQSLIALVENSLNELPTLAQNLYSHIPNSIGPFAIDISAIDLNSLSSKIIDSAQVLLGRTGEFLGTVASGAVNTLGWTVFVILISFFILLESRGLREGILPVNVPGYTEDFKRMGLELARIWNAFLRGQLIVITTAAVIYSIVLSALGVRYALGLAVMAGMARFLPYVGPAINWTVLALVSFFQVYKPLGMTPLVYMLVVLIIAWIIDGVLDNIVSPRIMAESLKVHPAAVLVAAIIALDLLGVLGVIIAAPILATVQLMSRYVLRKMFDLDPWEGMAENPTPPSLREQFNSWLQNIREKFKVRHR